VNGKKEKNILIMKWIRQCHILKFNCSSYYAHCRNNRLLHLKSFFPLIRCKFNSVAKSLNYKVRITYSFYLADVFFSCPLCHVIHRVSSDRINARKSGVSWCGSSILKRTWQDSNNLLGLSLSALSIYVLLTISASNWACEIARSIYHLMC